MHTCWNVPGLLSVLDSALASIAKAILFAIMVAIVRRVKPKCFMHECTSLFPGVHYFRRLLPEYTVVHFVVDPREHGSPTRRKRVYDLCLRADMDLPGGSSDFYRLYASTTTDASVFIGAGDEEVLCL